MGGISVKSILNGWNNLLFNSDENIKTLARERANICSGCPQASAIAGIPYCTQCKCPLAAKTQSIYESCPLGRWKQVK